MSTSNEEINPLIGHSLNWPRPIDVRMQHSIISADATEHVTSLELKSPSARKLIRWPNLKRHSLASVAPTKEFEASGQYASLSIRTFFFCSFLKAFNL